MGHRFPQHLHALTASGMVLCEDVGHSNPQKLRPLKRPFLLARTPKRAAIPLLKFLDPHSPTSIRYLQRESASGKNSIGGDADGSTVAYRPANSGIPSSARED